MFTAERLTRPFLLFTAAFLLSTVVACSDGSERALLSITDESPTKPSLKLGQTDLDLGVGETHSLQPVVTGAGGGSVNATQMSWGVEDPTVAEVSPAGVVRGVAPGETKVNASYGALKASLRVKISYKPKAIEFLGPNPVTGTVGTALPDSVKVRVLNAFGNPLSGVEVRFLVTAGGGKVSKAYVKTGSEGVAGTVWTLGSGVGTQILEASVNGLPEIDLAANAVANATVANLALLLGNNQNGVVGAVLPTPLCVKITDGSGNPLPGLTIQWSFNDGGGLITASGSPSPTLTTVSDERGISETFWHLGTTAGIQEAQVVVVSGSSGSSALAGGPVLAASAGFTANANPAAPAVVHVTPATISMIVGGRAQLSATVTDQYQNAVTNASLSWTSSSPSVATVNASGEVTGLAAGNATITATAGEAEGHTTATITSPSPDVLSIVSGNNQTGSVGSALGTPLRVRLLSSAGLPRSGQAITWSVTAGSGSLSASTSQTDSQGYAQIIWTLGTTPGMQTVAASASGTGSQSFNASALPGQLATISVTPGTDSIAAGETLQFSAAGADRYGNPLAGIAFSWTSSTPGVATVSSSGLATAVAAGSAQIRASAGAITGSSTLTVTATAQVQNPGTVADLSVVGTTSGAATLRWTEVDNGSGAPARYDVRYAVTPLGWGWGQATVVSQGSCSTPVQGQAVGQPITCTVEGLNSGQSYDFQLVAYRGDFGGTVTFGGLSNIATGVTSAPASNVLAKSSGDGQSGTVGAALAQPLRVRLTSSTGTPVAGQTVTWAVIAGNGSVSASSTTTDAQGYAQVTWTLGTTPGGNGVTASVSGAGSVTFGATALVGPVANIAVSPPTASIQVPGTRQFTAAATDQYGNAVGGTTFTWSSASTPVATVSASGLATGVSAGTVTITARSTNGTTATATLTVTAPVVSPLANECSAQSPAWLWCDDFETNRLGSYFEYDNAGGRFTRQAGVGVDASSAMQATFAPGTSNAGNLKLAFGSTPTSYMSPVDAGALRYRDVYWRMFVRTQAGWTGGGADKLSRAMVMANGSWAEAAIGHIWSAGGTATNLAMEPVRGTDVSGTLLTTGYNDFAHFTWLGGAQGSAQIFSTANSGTWACVEAHMQLNDAGLSNGILEFWVDGALQAQKSNLNYLGAFSAYGINNVFFENYWNAGSPVTQSRYFDNIVVSTEPIGCNGGTPGGSPPVAAVTISGGATVAAGSTLALTATQKDKNNTTIAGALSWASSSTGVATVNPSTGLVTGVAAGTTTITATSTNGKTGSIILTVTGAAPAPVASVTVAPGTATIQIGATQQLTATARDASGNILTGRTITWTTSSAGVASVSSAGLVTGQAAGGPVTITATSEGRSGTASITVAAATPQVTSVTASPASVSLTALGTTSQVSATARDGSGAVVGGATFTWQSLDSSVATVSSSGLVTSQAPGSTSIVVSATCCSAADTVPVTVSQVPDHVTMSPSSLSLQIGQSQTLSASLRDANDRTIPGASFTWSSVNSSIASVNGSGAVSAVAAGSTQIRATASGVTGSATVTVAASGGAAPVYEMDWPFANMTQLRAHRDYSDSGTADDNMSVLQGLSTPWGGSTAVRRPVTGGYNSVGINWDWPTIAQARAREIWLEIWQRFSPSWHVVSVPQQTTDDKTYFWLPNTNVRWELKFINSDVRVYVNNSPVPGGASVQIPGGEAGLHDGQWHRIRVHLRMGSNGAYEVWYDDQKILSATGFNTGNGSSDYFAWCALGRNGGFQSSATMDFGKMSIWTTNPGW